ncbi:MAG: hypothetical protein ACT4NT_00150 [Nitrososphaerota archaeon]
MEEISRSKNTEFYAACNEYFAALRKQGRNDDGFEDEFFYTMPVISGSN